MIHVDLLDRDVELLIAESLSLVTQASRCRDRVERLRMVGEIRRSITRLRAWAYSAPPSELRLRASRLVTELAQGLGRLPGVRTYA